jgi:hypothetical protein
LIDLTDETKAKEWTADIAVLILMLHMKCTEAYEGVSQAVREELGNVPGEVRMKNTFNPMRSE